MNKKPKHLKKLATLNLRVDAETLRRIDRLARADFETGRSEVARRALAAGLARLERALGAE